MVGADADGSMVVLCGIISGNEASRHGTRDGCIFVGALPMRLDPSGHGSAPR